MQNNIYMKIMRKILLLTLTCLSVVGCGVKSDMFSDIHIQANTSMPLGSLSFTDSTLFALAGDFSSQLTVSSDHILTINIDDSLSLVDRNKLDKVFKMPDQTKTFTIVTQGVPGGVISLDGASINYTMIVPNNERIDSTIFAQVAVIVNIEGTQDKSNVRATFSEIVNIQTGVPLTVPIGQTINIGSNYAIVPQQTSTIKNGLTIMLSGTMPYVSELKGETKIGPKDLQYLNGYLGRKEVLSPSITISSTQEFKEFASMVDYIYFVNPKIVFNIENQYNAPMMFTIDTLQISGRPVDLKTGSNRFFLNAYAKTQFIITNQNTVSGNQLSTLIDKNFTSFKVDVNTVMNPDKAEVGALDGSYIEPTHNSFSATDSVVGTYAMSIPMDGVLENVHFEQELDIDISSLNSANSTIRAFAFAFTGKNYMPLDISINAFVRAGDQPDGAKILLFKEPVRIASSLNNTINATPSVIDGSNRKIVDIKDEALDKMFASKKIYLELTTSTRNATSREIIKIFSPSSLELGLQVGAKIDLTTSNNQN